MCAGVRGVLHEAVDEGVGIQASAWEVGKKDRQHIVADQCSRLTAEALPGSHNHYKS